jgi:hypothetical protein
MPARGVLLNLLQVQMLHRVFATDYGLLTTDCSARKFPEWLRLLANVQRSLLVPILTIA